MSNDNDSGPNQPLEFMVLNFKQDGFKGTAWFHGSDRLGTDDVLENMLNNFGNEGWDVIQYTAAGTGLGRIILRRKAR